MRITRPIRRLLLQLLLLLGLFSISRAVFTLLNYTYFSGLSVQEYMHLAISGLRFDISIIFIINLLYIVLLFLPFRQNRLAWWEQFMNVLFVTVNSIALLFEVADWAYYPFTLKRATADILDMVTRKGDFWLLLPHFIVDYWYSFLGCIAAIFLLAKLNQKISKRYPLYVPPREDLDDEESISGRIVLFILVLGFSIICIRGGLQTTPINRASALEAGEGSFSQIVLNTPYSIISTLSNNKLPEHEYYSETELARYVNPVKQYKGKPFQSKNVVIIILESFSKQFTGQGQFKSYTPFLDSLSQHSFVCRNAYANALHSAEGIPAIIAGIPSLMEEPITTSQYGIDRMPGLPGILKNKNYASSFYHGGTNGTMAFDQFAINAGFDKYYGRTEYDNNKDYDGNWGIWDEPFMQYFAKGLKKTRQPFISTVFTLSSHDPFEVPEQYKNKLPQGPLKALQSIAYTDMAVRKFFETVSKEAYYKNTLFVITADHCSLMTQDENDHNNMGFYRIPLMFFAPGDTTMRGGTDELVQHIDIVPSVLDYLGYDQRFFAFGNSIFTPYKNRMAINELNNSFQFVAGDYIFKTDEYEINGIFNFSKDFKCWHNLLEEPEGIAVRKEQEPYFKAFLQLYNHALIHDKMRVAK